SAQGGTPPRPRPESTIFDFQLYICLGETYPRQGTRLTGGGDALSSYELSFLDSTFRIGEETGPYIRQGLNSETAQKIAELIREIAAVDAVAVTNDRTILGYAGTGCPYMVRGRSILTAATRQAIQTGQARVVNSKEELACPIPGCPCPLQGAVIAPLKVRQQVVGTVKLYRTGEQDFPALARRLALGISQLLSLQLEVGESERLRELAARARLEALQAQIRPHFLFNTLNTVLMFTRTDIERARELLVQLASFLRRALTVRAEFIPVEDELEYVQTYLEIEKARFGQALRFKVSIDPASLGCLVPVLTIQPLVENAVVHGLVPQEGGGRLLVRTRVRHDRLEVVVYDTGVGIPRHRRDGVFTPGVGKGMGLGLANINQRLMGLYGEPYGLRLLSRPGRGTLARMTVPVRRAADRREAAGR